MQFQKVNIFQDQIEELQIIIHNISQQNKLKLEEVLAQQTEIQSTSLLSLYNIVVKEWNSKRKTIEELCQYANSMMTTLDFLKEQIISKDDKISTADSIINNLQNQIYQLHDLNEIYKQKLNDAQMKLQSLQQQKEEFRDQLQYEQTEAHNTLVSETQYHKQNEQCQQHQVIMEDIHKELIRQSSMIIFQKEEDIQMLHKQKRQLIEKLQQISEQSKLMKMQLQLAQIAMKQVIQSRNELESMINSQSYKNSQKNQIDQIQLSCNSIINNSRLQKKLLSHQFQTQQDLIHFSSTPCLFFTQKSSLQKQNSMLSQNYSLESPLIISQQKELNQQNEYIENKKTKCKRQNNEYQNNLDYQYSFVDENCEDLIKNLCLYDSVVNQEKESVIRLTDQTQIQDMISRLNIRQSKISEFEATQTSFQQIKSQFNCHSINLFSSINPQSPSHNFPSLKKNQSFLSYFKKKVIKDRIRTK